ncbi:MAG: hypothetical protein IH624_02410 [Phycisphaerae bacterium]|nr:hypothetical protein [Phycisphaerae bacterium]
MLKKKKGNLLEQHAEKLVLGVAVLISVVLLAVFVIGGPNAVKIGARKLGPGEVDRQVRAQAERLADKLSESPTPAVYPAGKAKELYLAKLQSPLEAVPDFKLVAPGRTEIAKEDRTYSVPMVPPALNAVAESIRGAAHVPVDEVTPENPYDKALTSLKDMDLVTVQASLDVAALYRSYKQSFVMGRNLKAEWKDDELATPVFASVQLQRRRMLDAGRWSDWETVARPKIDQYRVRLDIPQQVEALKYDISMQKAQFKPFAFQQNLLQPRPYDYASADAVWLTPSFYKEYAQILDREQKEALRLERERSLGTRGRETTGYEGGGRTTAGGRGGLDPQMNPTVRDRQATTRGRQNDPAVRGYDEYGGDSYGLGADDPRRRRQRTTSDVVADNIKIIIDERMRLEELREPLIFWAHDDTVEPGKTYEYRIRLGVFNPIAGKNWFGPTDQQYNNQVILWSEFANVPAAIVIPPMAHFFPTELARSTEGGVVIEVAKYHMGNWRKQDFEVRPGEMIGKTVDLKPQVPAAGRMEGYDEYSMGGATPALPEKIDFGTGAMLVDVVKSDAWTGIRMVRSELIEVLYTEDGLTMQQRPVRKNSWTGTMKVQYGQIESAATKTVQVSTARNQSKVNVFQQRGIITSPYQGGRERTGGDRYMDAGIEYRR